MKFPNASRSIRSPFVISLFILPFFFFLNSVKVAGATLTVPSTAYPTIQSAINAANPGDTIVLQAGVTFVEAVVLKYKPGNDYITIQSSALSNLPPAGQRVSPSDAPNMPKIVPPSSGDAAISTEITSNGPAHHYKLIGIEIAQANDNQLLYNLVSLGDGGQTQNTLNKVAHNFIIDRCYIHGTTNGRMSRAIGLNSAETTIINSYISEIHNVGIEAQGICGWNGPGPFLIENNYIEASTQGLMFGGAEPHIHNLVPQNIQIRRNFFSRPLAWFNGTPHWLVKNIFELKNARSVTVTENIFENNWPDGQGGYSILFTVRNQGGGAPWSTIEDVDFSHNIVRNVPYGVNILVTDNIFPSQNLKNISIRYNLFSLISSVVDHPLYGKCIQLTGGQPGLQNLTLDHNTCIGRGVYPDFLHGDGTVSVTGMNIRNNIAVSPTSGADTAIAGNSMPGTSGLNSIAGSTWQLQRNILMLPNGSSAYPNSGSNINYYVSTPASVGFTNFANGNYSLLSTSPYHNLGTDGTDPGANIAALEQTKPCIYSGNWASCSGTPAVQTPYPGPSTPAIPTTIEVENFDRGGQGIAYNNNYGSVGSGAYRSAPVEAVSITANSTASNGFAVFEAAAGEWLEYTLNIPASGLYNFAVRYSSGYAQAYSQGTFRLEACEPTSGGGVTNCVSSQTVKVNSTGGWGAYQIVKAPLYLPASGTRILRLVMVANAPGDTGCNCVVANFDSIAVSSQRTLFDYDNDRKADVSVFRPSTGIWYLQQSSAGFSALAFGISTDIIAPADFDGDGKTDIAVFRPGTGVWYITNSSNGSTTILSFGISEDIPVQADYDGDGKADVSVWRPSNGTWHRLDSSTGAYQVYSFGSFGDRPAVGDYDGDGKSDFAVFRPSTGVWYLQQSQAGFLGLQFGTSTDKITPADYDGDGKTDMCYFRPSTGTWYVFNSSSGQISSLNFGSSTDAPSPSDFDGDGKADFAVFRGSTGVWYLQQSSAGSWQTVFGINSDLPTPSTYVR